MRDLVNTIGAAPVVAPQILTATNTSAAIDLLGFEAAALVITTGAIVAAGDFTAKLQHSDTTVAGDFVDVPVAGLIGSLPIILAADSTYKIGYIGNRRYVRSIVTRNGGTSIAAQATLIKADARNRPVA